MRVRVRVYLEGLQAGWEPCRVVSKAPAVRMHIVMFKILVDAQLPQLGQAGEAAALLQRVRQRGETGTLTSGMS